MTAPPSTPDPVGSPGPPVLIEVRDRVAVVTLNRPDVLNAFSGEMGRLLDETYRRCDTDDDIRAVVLTGAGRAFCAGADLSDGAAVFDAPGDRAGFRSDPLHFPAWRVRKPVIAAVNGHAMGLGLTMTFHADLRVMARDAKYGVVQNRRGIMPDLHSHWTLPRIVGPARAAEILLTGKTFSGDEAERWGLANETHEAADVLTRAVEIGRDIATWTAPVSVGVSKRLLWLDPPPDRDEVLALESELHVHLMGRADTTEGVTAFLEKREPRWSLSVNDDWPAFLDES